MIIQPRKIRFTIFSQPVM